MVLSELLEGYKKKIGEMFDTRIDYNRSELHARLADHLVQLAAPQPNERVLDIATGTGFVAIPAARLVGEWGSVVGVDISVGMLEQAAKAVADAKLSNVDLVRADAEALVYSAGSFDLIFCCNALPYMTEVPAALRHWHSLLRPGGRLAFNCWAENSYVTGHLFRTIAARHSIRIAVIGRNTGTPDNCRAILSAAGFVLVEVMAEPTATYFSVDQLKAAPESAMKNPLYGITSSDENRLRSLHDEYMAEARSSFVRKDINAEVGAYFVLGHKMPATL